MTLPSSTPAPSSTLDRIEWFNKAKDGDTAALQNFLDNGHVSLEDAAHDGSTALHCAAGAGNEAGVAFLLQQGANLEATNKKFRTPLHEAILSKHQEIVKHLLREGASLVDLWKTSECLVRSDTVEIFMACMEFLGSVTLQDDLKRLTLHNASQSRAGKLLPALLSPEHNKSSLPNDAGTTPRLVDGRDNLSWATRPGRNGYYTPMHHAVLKGNLDVVKLLVQNKFMVNVSTNYGTPLHTAARCSNLAIVEYLLGLPNVQVHSVTPTSRMTPLHFAAQKGRVSAARSLLVHPETRLNAVDIDQRTALYYAANAGHLEMVDFLLGQKQIDLAAPNGTLLRHVAFRGRWPIVRTLLDYQSRQGGEKAATTSPAAQIQVSSSHLVEELRRHPDFQDINIVDMFGRFLRAAAKVNDSDLVRYLLNHSEVDVDPNYGDDEFTPLYYAVAKGHYASVKELLKHAKIDVNKLWMGKTTLELAKRSKRSDIADLLIAHGAVDDSRESQSSTRDEHASSIPSALDPQDGEDNSLGHSIGVSWCNSPEVTMEDVDWLEDEIDWRVGYGH